MMMMMVMLTCLHHGGSLGVQALCDRYLDKYGVLWSLAIRCALRRYHSTRVMTEQAVESLSASCQLRVECF